MTRGLKVVRLPHRARNKAKGKNRRQKTGARIQEGIRQKQSAAAECKHGPAIKKRQVRNDLPLLLRDATGNCAAAENSTIIRW
jgi:hypothetical protein